MAPDLRYQMVGPTDPTDTAAHVVLDGEIPGDDFLTAIASADAAQHEMREVWFRLFRPGFYVPYHKDSRAIACGF
jgi:hypothetical protein